MCKQALPCFMYKTKCTWHVGPNNGTPRNSDDQRIPQHPKNWGMKGSKRKSVEKSSEKCLKGEGEEG